jgi:outer membrane autotransporter protein
MEMKSKMRKLGLFTQAVLASSAMMLPMINAYAVEAPVANDGDPIGNTEWAKFTASKRGDVAIGAQMGTSDATADVVGVSAYNAAGITGNLRFLGAGGADSDLGQSTSVLGTIDTAGGATAVNLLGQVFANDIDLDNAGGAATVTLKGNTTVTNNIDFKSNKAHIINVDNTNGSLSLTTGTGVTTTNAGVGKLNFLGDSTTTVSGILGTAAGGELAAVTTAGAGTVNLNNNVAATAITLGGTGAVNLTGGDTEFEGAVALANTATLNLNNNKLDVNGGVGTFTTGGAIATRIATEVSDATSVLGTDKGTIITTGAATTNAANLLTITPAGYLTQGGSGGVPIKLITDGAGGAGVVAIPAANITGQSAVLSFDTSVVASNLQLDVVRRAYNSGVHNLNTQAEGLGAALEADGAAGRLAILNPDAEEFVGLVDSLATSAEVATALASAAPTVNSAIAQVAHEVGERVTSNIDNRLTLVRSGQSSYNTGMSAGDTTVEGWGVWGELFGSDFTQDKRNGIEGYDGNMWGVTLGVDWQVDSATILGLAATYSTTDVDHDLARNNLDIDSFQGSLYGSFSCNPWYVQGMLGLAHHDYDQTRHIIAGATAVGTALADYKAWEWLANVEAGYVYKQDEWNLIPSALLRYSHLDIDNYDERGAAGANLSVKNDNINAFVAGLGLKVQYDSNYADSRIVPEAHFNIYYDFIADRQIANSTMFGTGTVFSAKGFEPSKDSYEVGVGLNIYTARNSVFSVNYDYLFKSDFDSHSGFVKLRYQW